MSLKNIVVKQCDYMELLKSLENKSVDFICIDPPYGKINGMQLDGQKEKVDWDVKIDWKEMFREFNRVIRDGGTICVFGQQPTFAEMILSNVVDFKYELIWEKNNAAQGFHVDKMPLGFTENIAVFIHNENKSNKRVFNNIATWNEIDKDIHFCRWYAQQLCQYINIPRRKIHERLGHRKLEFFFNFTGKHFGLLSETLYNELIEEFNIDKFDKFINYETLKEIWDKEKDKTKNVKLDSQLYSKTLSNVLKVQKENDYLHPTQKPKELIEKLVLMYTNENDLVLDCFLGSGTTAVVCKKLKRKFVGCEISEKYIKVINERLK